jgi:hypothetical protein
LPVADCIGSSDAYTNTSGHQITLLSKVFTTRPLVQIIFVMVAVVVMKRQARITILAGHRFSGGLTAST